MTELNKLRSYSDLRKFVTPGAFAQAMNFIAWHNRLTMTPMLEPWEALVITLVHEERSLDGMFYNSVKTFLEETRDNPVLNLEQARQRASLLIAKITTD